MMRGASCLRSAIAFAGEIARDCNFPTEAFDPCGKINAAASASGTAHNRDYARHLESLGEPFELLDASAMQAISGSDYYQGGLRTPRHRDAAACALSAWACRGIAAAGG